MQFFKIKIIVSVVCISVVFPSSAKSTEECFEKVSRAVFKFNMAVDDIFLEL